MYVWMWIKYRWRWIYRWLTGIQMDDCWISSKWDQIGDIYTYMYTWVCTCLCMGASLSSDLLQTCSMPDINMPPSIHEYLATCELRALVVELWANAFSYWNQKRPEKNSISSQGTSWISRVARISSRTEIRGSPMLFSPMWGASSHRCWQKDCLTLWWAESVTMNRMTAAKLRTLAAFRWLQWWEKV